jgi:D-alanine--poly(phosphoribitol) ligase subunit 2
MVSLSSLKCAGSKKVANPETLANEVAQILSENLHLDVPSYDLDLFAAGMLDSLQLVELVFQLEEQFGIKISLGETDLKNFRTIDCIVAMLARCDGHGPRD